MAKIIPITEHFQHFLAEMKESFWGDLYGQTQLAWQRFFELQSERERDRFSGAGRYERRRGRRRIYRNGYYERDFVTRFGTIRLRIARTREKSFLPVGLRRFQRRAEEVSLLIREAFLRGISTRQVGRVVATITGETVSAQTVSKLTRDLDVAVRQFHQARLSDDYVYLFLDGVSLRVRRPAGRKRVQMLVAYGIRRDGSRHLLAFLRSQGEGQADWEGLLQDLYRRGLEGRSLGLILTAGCSGLAAAVRRLQQDLPELLSFFAFPRHLWRKLRTTNVIERCFVEVRRRTRPMVCFVNVESVDRIIYSIFQRFNLEWKTRTLNLFTQAA